MAQEEEEIYTQRMAEDYLKSEDAFNEACAEAAEDVFRQTKRAKAKRKAHDDDDLQAAQALLADDDDAQWQPDEAAYTEHEVPKTLAEMVYKLERGSVHVRLHPESNDHIFLWANNRLGKPIQLFRGATSDLLNDFLPHAYAVYDENCNKVDEMEENQIVSRETLVVTPYIKLVVEVSVFQKKLYVFLKRMSKPEAIAKSPFAKKSSWRPINYDGPRQKPDEDGFVHSKGCSIQFDRYNDDPTKILAWAKECIMIPA
jgi:hypothetical protein